MGIQINGQTDTISAIDGSLNLTGAELPSVTNLNATGIVTASSFSGALTGNVNATGVSTFNNVVVGGANTALVVSGNARITGILTVGSGTITINPTTDSISGVTTLGVTTTYTTNLTVNGNAYPTSGPLSNRNLIINGAMAVAQRGTSSTSTGYRTVDRIDSTYSGITQTQSQESLTSGDPYNEGFRYFYRVTNTSTSSATSAISEIQQKIEGQNINQSGWNFKSSSSYLTVSFWVRSSLAGTYYFWLFSPETSSVGYYRIPFTLSANTWKKVTHTIPGNSGLTIDNDNGIGLHCYWVPHYGTDYTGSTAQTEQWSGRSGNDYLQDFPQNWCNTASATFDITGVQLEPGTVATPFEHRSYGDELARCQRYYFNTWNSKGLANPGSSADPYFGARGRVADITGYWGQRIFLPTRMRDEPSITIWRADGGTGTAGECTLRKHDNTSTNTTAVSAQSISQCSFHWWHYTGTTVGVSGDVVECICHYEAQSEL